MNYPLASSTWDQNELDAIYSVIESNHFSMGEKVRLFEEKFADYFKSKYCVMVNSGSSANLLMIASLFYRKEGLSLKAGDEIIVPAVSWSTTYFPLMQYGLKLKFVDIDIDTLNLDINSLEESITKETKAIFAVNLLGNPNNFQLLKNIADKNDLLLIEDNCESMGAKFNHKYCGTYGLMGSFSLFFSHHINTMEGGMILTNDEELYQILLSIRSHGWTRSLPKINKISNKTNDDFYEAFRFVLPGYNVRPIEMEGAVGIEQLKKLDSFIKIRRDNALVFKDIISRYGFIKIQEETDFSSWFGFSMIIDSKYKLKRNDLIKIFIEKKIDVRPIVSGNFTKNEAIKFFNYCIHGDLKNSNLLHDNGFFIGNHQYSLDKEFQLLEDVLSKC